MYSAPILLRAYRIPALQTTIRSMMTNRVKRKINGDDNEDSNNKSKTPRPAASTSNEQEPARVSNVELNNSVHCRRNSGQGLSTSDDLTELQDSTETSVNNNVAELPELSIENQVEERVGITEYVSKNPGFQAVMKSRFSDFLVNEIDPSGKVVHLTDLSVPKPQKPTVTLDAVQVSEIKSEVGDAISDDNWNKLDEMAKAKTSVRLASEPVRIEVELLDKMQRTKIHQAIKQMYKDILTSTTENVQITDDDGKQSMKKFITIKSKQQSGKGSRDWDFPGTFVHFTVLKENTETSQLTQLLADRLGLRPSQVSYAGTKDKRAITVQRLCIRYREPARISGAVRKLSQLQVGNFEFTDKVLKLGDLSGNRFNIVLRHVRGERAKIEQALHDLKEKGFINYYGLQRFGSAASVPTYHVGIALLKQNYKEAVELIMKPRENESSEMNGIRKFWWDTRDNLATLAQLKHGKCIERCLMNGLVQHAARDYCNAFSYIPRNMMMLYVHSFQSLIFNQIASRRINEFGLLLIEGDLVFVDKEKGDKLCLLADEMIGESDGPEPGLSRYQSMVRPLTADDIATGAYTVHDVVLTLPGHDVTYPKNVVADWYTEMLAEHGLTIEQLQHPVKTMSLPGAYRKMLVLPQNLSWKFDRYSDHTAKLVLSDIDVLRGEEIVTDNQGIYTALILDFCLPSSTYATMMIRELTKSDTGSAHQALLEQRIITSLHKTTAGAEIDQN